MSDLTIPWRPRVIMPGRLFRLPVASTRDGAALEAAPFRMVDSRWSPRGAARYYYLRSPDAPGDYTLTTRQDGHSASVVIQVRSLDQLRMPCVYNGAIWPRRWPLEKAWSSTKTGQTLQDMPDPAPENAQDMAWWIAQTDETLWRQFPYPEFPQAHFVNVTQGCPNCGTAVFIHSGFYPWKRNHLPCDYRSVCPSCSRVYPSNDVMAEDFTSGDAPDDGFGYFDAEGHIYLFTATYHRDQVNRFDAGMRQLIRRLRSGGFDEAIARKLGLMLARYAVDILYVAAVPQFRYGPSMGVEQPWNWGQPDWADEKDPVGALLAKGMRRYCIDIPYVSETLALGYDTLWPFLNRDCELADRVGAFVPGINNPEDVVQLIEEMLACQLQCVIDRGARSNLPRESMGALVLLRGLDRPDAGDVMDWLYDKGPDRLRVFGVNDFLSDGCPPEATGGYNNIHAMGLFALEYHLRHLRTRHPEAYPESRYPSLMADPRAPRVIRHTHEITMIGRSWFQYGDGSAPGSKALHGRETESAHTLILSTPAHHSGLDAETLSLAAEYTGDPVVREIKTAAETGRHRRIGSTIHDGVGIAILRTGEAPERAALGVVYGDTTGHRHMDLLDTQLFAFERPFLTDLGYPQSWASIRKWEANWATHNSVWAVIPGCPPNSIAGRGKLRRSLLVDGLQALDIEAERWTTDTEKQRWVKADASFRRLLALVETDDEGVAIVDLSRIYGGAERWRVCRGIHGAFETPDLTFTPRSGTVADAAGVRGKVDDLAVPDYDGLACMDDVALSVLPEAWKGCWISTVEPSVCLDVHQITARGMYELINARSTAVMGTPEQSSYTFRTLLWRGKNTETDAFSGVDLVFEPRVGPATLAEVNAIPAESRSSAVGVEMITKKGKRLTLYWAPDAGEHEKNTFADGTEITGPLAATIDRRVYGVGVSFIRGDGKTHASSGPQRGRITRFSHTDRVVEVEGLTGITAGERVVVNPEGRGRNYRVEQVETTDSGMLRLTLDVSPVFGRGPILSCDGARVELDATIMTRTGNLDQTRLIVESDGSSAVIEGGFNPEQNRTVLYLEKPSGIKELTPGTWVSVVDYMAGDVVLFEPVFTV